MHQDIRTSLQSGKLLAPRVVDVADVFSLIDALFARQFTTPQDLMSASVTDLIVHDFETEGKIENVRNLITHVANKPQGPYHVFVFFNIDKMTDQSANALLKTFEDIQPHTLFLLTCRHAHMLLPTIKSRVIIMSHDQKGSDAESQIQQEVHDFIKGSYSGLISRILGNKIDRSQCIDIANALQSAIKDGSITDSATIQAVVTSLDRITMSKVTAKYQIDNALFKILRGKKL